MLTWWFLFYKKKVFSVKNMNHILCVVIWDSIFQKIDIQYEFEEPKIDYTLIK